MNIKNEVISSIVCPKVEAYVASTLGKEGFTTSSIAVMDVDSENLPGVLLCDPDSDTGTYQFYKLADGSIVVADYFDVGNVYRVFNDGDVQKFHDEFDLVVNLNHISELLDIAVEHNSYMYIQIDSDFINHHDLIKRDGWSDRKIKKHFGVVKVDELDNVRYYRMNEVLAAE